MTETTFSADNVIHIASVLLKNQKVWLFLVRDGSIFNWWKVLNGVREKTAVGYNTIEEAIRLAAREWKNDSFQSLRCGTRFTLPERDEVGRPALFWECRLSYKSFNGVYIDPTSGHPCDVRNASQDALNFVRTLAS